MSETSAALTQTELLALALESSRNGDSGRSLAYLKEAAARPDASAQVCFLLGSEYAQLRLMNDALAQMHRAVEIDPGYAIARFQLGMVYLTSGLAEQAQQVWEPLQQLGDDSALKAFHKAMLHLVADEGAEALEWIERGVQLNQENPALNNDMRMVADELRKLAVAGSAQPSAAEQPSKDGTDASADEAHEHLFLAAYQRGTTH